MNPQHPERALRLVLHATGWEDLLNPDDQGDDLFDEGLLAVNPDHDGVYDITEAGDTLIRSVTGAPQSIEASA